MINVEIVLSFDAFTQMLIVLHFGGKNIHMRNYSGHILIKFILDKRYSHDDCLG